MSTNSYKRLSEGLDLTESQTLLSHGIRSTPPPALPRPINERTTSPNRFKKWWNICITQMHIDYTGKAVMLKAWIPYLLVIAVTVMAGGIAGYMAADHRQLFADRSYSSLGSCGLTSEANQESGCVYDFIMGSWIDSRCHNKSLYVKYVEQVRELNLTYYIDQDGTTEVPLEIALQGNHPVLYTSGVQHHLHCTYFWEKQWMAWKYGGKAWDSDTLSEEHTMHCITINGQPRVDELRNRTVTKVYAPDDRIQCMRR